jgi:hypothetical protein
MYPTSVSRSDAAQGEGGVSSRVRGQAGPLLGRPALG